MNLFLMIFYIIEWINIPFKKHLRMNLKLWLLVTPFIKLKYNISPLHKCYTHI